MAAALNVRESIYGECSAFSVLIWLRLCSCIIKPRFCALKSHGETLSAFYSWENEMLHPFRAATLVLPDENTGQLDYIFLLTSPHYLSQYIIFLFLPLTFLSIPPDEFYSDP